MPETFMQWTMFVFYTIGAAGGWIVIIILAGEIRQSLLRRLKPWKARR